MPIPSRRDTIYLHRGDDGKVRIGVTRDGKTTYWNGWGFGGDDRSAAEIREVVAGLLHDAREYALGGGAVDPDPPVTTAEYTRQLRRARDCQKEAGHQAERAEHFRRRLLELEPRVDWANRLREERDQLIAGTHPLSVEPRIDRQRAIFDWATAAFGADQVHPAQRALRLLEEAVELFQACDGDRAQAHKLIDFVFDRPLGAWQTELGQVGVTLLALAASLGASADDAEAAEVARVLAKPIEHYTKRNEAKNEAGFLAKPLQPHHALLLKDTAIVGCTCGLRFTTEDEATRHQAAAAPKGP